MELFYKLGNVAPSLFYFAILFQAITAWSLPSLLLFCLLVVNEGVNFILKRIIRKPRPNEKKGCSIWFKDEGKKTGMPSAHAQFFGFSMVPLEKLLLLFF